MFQPICLRPDNFLRPFHPFFVQDCFSLIWSNLSQSLNCSLVSAYIFAQFCLRDCCFQSVGGKVC